MIGAFGVSPTAGAVHVTVIVVLVAARAVVVDARDGSQPMAIWVRPTATPMTVSYVSIFGVKCTPIASTGANNRPTVAVFDPAEPVPAAFVAVTEKV